MAIFCCCPCFDASCCDLMEMIRREGKSLWQNVQVHFNNRKQEPPRKVPVYQPKRQEGPREPLRSYHPLGPDFYDPEHTIPASVEARPRPRPQGQEMVYTTGLGFAPNAAHSPDPRPIPSALPAQAKLAGYANFNLHSKKSLSVDSPAFTPSTLSVPAKQQTLPSQAANAAPFTPRGHVSGTATPNPQPEPEPASTFNPATIKEFTPQNYSMSQELGNGAATDAYADPFTMQGMSQDLPNTSYNPYEHTTATMATNSTASYFGGTTGFGAPAQPPQYHLYAPIGPHREDLLPYQRTIHDFFIDNALREHLHKKNEATLQVMPNSQLPNVDHFHSLVALDTSHHESVTIFGYPTWVYKALSSKNGNYFVLRRLRGYRLSNEGAIRAAKEWKRVESGSVVSVIDVFTTRAFGDSSLIFVYNYHPMSKTLVEQHMSVSNRYGNRAGLTPITEQVLWSYVVQLATAIKAAHSAGLAIRCVDPSKIIVTEKNRIRLNACGILDVTQFDANRPLAELQQEDLVLFGKLLLCLATNTSSMTAAAKLTVGQLARTHTVEFRDTISWLLDPAQTDEPKTINEFLRGISHHVVDFCDRSFRANDNLTSVLSVELENGRLARLLMKLDTVNDRPEYENNPKWAETGDRFALKLFRDYVFHQVDPQGKAVVNLGHIISALNKLDAGSNQMIKLVTRDDATCMYMTFKEIKKQFAAAFDDLVSQQAK